MRIKIKNINQKWKAYALGGSITALVFVVLWNLPSIFHGIGSFLGIFGTVIIGFAVAYVINPLAVFIDKRLLKGITNRNVSWNLAVIISLLIILAFFALILALLIPQLISSISSLVSNWDTYQNNLIETFSKFNNEFGAAAKSVIMNFVGDAGLGGFVVEELNVILTHAGSVGSRILSLLIGSIIAIYCLFAKNFFKDSGERLLKIALIDHDYQNAMTILTKFNSILSKYIEVEILDGAIIGVANLIFMLITGMPNALLISVIVGVTNLAPTFGPIVGAGIASVILLLVDPSYVFIFLIFTLVLQTIDGYVIKPKFFGGVLNVPGVLILISIIVFGNVLGVIGVILSIPIAAILVYIYQEFFIPWLQLKKELRKYREGIEKENNNGL